MNERQRSRASKKCVWFVQMTSDTANKLSILTYIQHYQEMIEKRAKSPTLSKTKCFFDRSGLAAPQGLRTNLAKLCQRRLWLPEQQQGPQITTESIEAEVMIFTSANSEAVAAFISPFMDNVTQDPAIYAKVMAEIDAAEARSALSSPVARYDETCMLPYFMACIYETFRHSTPTQTILPRYVSKEGIHVQGNFIPGGTEIAASPYIIHRDVDTFGKDAEAFRPERWLEDKARSAHMEDFGMWFGYGGRECPGRGFALLQIQKLCVQLLRDFEISPATSDKPFVMKRYAVAMFWNHWLRFQERAMVSKSE